MKALHAYSDKQAWQIAGGTALQSILFDPTIGNYRKLLLASFYVLQLTEEKPLFILTGWQTRNLRPMLSAPCDRLLLDRQARTDSLR